MKKALALAALMFSFAAMVVAAPLPAPRDAVLLTVTGAIAAQNAPDAAEFDLAMLQALGETQVDTSTVWTDGVHHFKGVRLASLMQTLGVTSGRLNMYAVNDYMVEVPVSDAVSDGPILAYVMDDQVMSLRDKGPLWLIYPFDAKAEYRTDVIYSRSIWQLDHIDVLP